MDEIRHIEKEFDLQKILLDEKFLLSQEQVECPVFHIFGPGIYIREVHLPAGSLVVGHHHRTEHTSLLLKGRLTLLNENGTTVELEAPFVCVSPAGRKVAYIHEDVVFQNIHATREKDVERLEEMLLDKSAVWVENKKMKDSVEKLKHEADREDYLKALAEYGFDHEMARALTERTEDQIGLPYGGHRVKLDDSPIEGKGLFATAKILAGEIIAPARIGVKRTFAGRFTNHSINPNARMELRDSGDIDLVAAIDIQGCHGGYNGEEITIDYRQALSLSLKKIDGGSICQQ